MIQLSGVWEDVMDISADGDCDAEKSWSGKDDVESCFSPTGPKAGVATFLDKAGSEQAS